MTFKVLFFASLRESVGLDFIEVECPPPCSVSCVVDVLESRLGKGEHELLRQEGVRIAVNHEMVEGDVKLEEGDEIAFFPPITGG